MPRFVYISKVDEDNSDYNATFEALREKYGNKIAPVVVPIWNSSKKVTGIIDVLNKRAYEMAALKRVNWFCWIRPIWCNCAGMSPISGSSSATNREMNCRRERFLLPSHRLAPCSIIWRMRVWPMNRGVQNGPTPSSNGRIPPPGPCRYSRERRDACRSSA